jgi:hypothetical protein
MTTKTPKRNYGHDDITGVARVGSGSFYAAPCGKYGKMWLPGDDENAKMRFEFGGAGFRRREGQRNCEADVRDRSSLAY